MPYSILCNFCTLNMAIKLYYYYLLFNRPGWPEYFLPMPPQIARCTHTSGALYWIAVILLQHKCRCRSYELWVISATVSIESFHELDSFMTGLFTFVTWRLRRRLPKKSLSDSVIETEVRMTPVKVG